MDDDDHAEEEQGDDANDDEEQGWPHICSCLGDQKLIIIIICTYELFYSLDVVSSLLASIFIHLL